MGAFQSHLQVWTATRASRSP
eukprot:COSAG06_NODE_20184_length_805_cov_1.130312_1_plen_20_part_10